MSSGDESDDEAFESADEEIGEDVTPVGQLISQSKVQIKHNHEESDDKCLHLNENKINESEEQRDVEKEINRSQTMQPNEKANCELTVESNSDQNNEQLIEKVSEQLKQTSLQTSNDSENTTAINPENLIEKSSDKDLTPKESTDFENEQNIVESKELINENSNESKVTEQQTIIKGRKLMRKADRVKNECEIIRDIPLLSEDKKAEVLNKLSEIYPPNTSRWNSWFSDIKSAAVSATTTTVSHASNWSIDPKGILNTAVSITSQVVENVGQAVDSAIGAPKPEDLAKECLQRNSEGRNKSEPQINENIGNNQTNSDSNDDNSGFANYTLNALELKKQD